MKNNISNELMTRFHCGDVSAEEFKEVLLAAEQDSDLKEEIAIMASLADDLAELKADLSEEMSNSNAKIISIQPSYVPMMLKAAQNKNLMAIGDCVVRCEHEILKSYQPEATFDSLLKLSEESKWLQDGGTPLYNIGRILESYKFSIVRRYDCNTDDIEKELQGGCHIIVVVNAEKLYGKDVANPDPNHAVVVRSLNESTITLFDPQYQREDNYGIELFLTAWKDSQYYIVSVAERGLRQYDPQPIDVTEFPLEGDIKDLIEAIAENCHDIWARERIDDGWTYGEKRDDDHKKHPDLVPYSDLTEEEKKYDRKMAQGTLELIQRLGYKIVKKK